MADSKNEIKIALLGYEKTGKTTFIKYLEKKSIEDINFFEYQPTNGASYHLQQLIYDNNYYQLNLWDTSGQEKYESLTKFFYSDADIILLFFSYNNEESFKKAKYLLKLVKDFSIKSNVIIALIGNKYQEKNCSDEHNIKVSEEEVLEFAQKKNLIYGHLSILENYSNGIIELVYKIMREYTKKSKK